MEVGLCDGLKRNGSIFLIVPFCSVQFSSVPSLSRIWLFVTPGTAAHQASLSITNSQSLLKLMSIELVMPSNHLILCHPLPLPPLIFPSIKVFPMSQFFTSGGQSIGASGGFNFFFVFKSLMCPKGNKM